MQPYRPDPVTPLKAPRMQHSISLHESPYAPSPHPAAQQTPLNKRHSTQSSTHPTKHWWTTEEDERLQELVEEYGARNWKKMASFLP